MSPSAERDALLDKAMQELILLKQAANKLAWSLRATRPKRERVYVTKDMKRVVDYLKGNPQRLSELLFEAASADTKPPTPAPAEPANTNTFATWLVAKGHKFENLTPEERELALITWKKEASANQ